MVGGVGKTLTLDPHPKIQRRHWENLLPGTGGLAPDLPQRGYNCIPESGSMQKQPKEKTRKHHIAAQFRPPVFYAL